MKKIMIIDDEIDFLTIAKMNLEATGKYEIMTLLSGVDIIKYVAEFKPDIILLDIVMPKIDGVKVCKILKGDSESAEIPIIALTALDTDEDRLAMHKSGVVDFLTKPIEKDVLISKIEEVLQGN